MDFSNEGMGVVASLRRFFRLYFNAISKEISRDSLFRIGIKRVCVLGLSLLTFPLLIIWTHFGFWLDDIFFSGWKNVEVKTPCFIVGNARSGTTWFHRVLAKDETHFTGPKTWELIFAQPVTYRYLFYKLGKVDAFFGGIGFKCVRWIDTFCFGKSKVHPISLMEAEEDEWLMAQVCCCQLLALIFPLIDVFHSLIWFDKTLPLESRRAIYQHYRRCVQRHLFAHTLLHAYKREEIIPVNTFPRYLSKNPTFTLRIDSIFDTFPDARVIVMIRNPYHAIPSMVSYIQKCWANFAEPVVPRPFRSELQNMCSYHYTYPHEYRETHPKLRNQIAILHYEDCKSNLMDSVTHLYKTFFSEENMEILPDRPTMDLIEIDQIRSKNFVSSHSYSTIDTCGLTETEFEERHAEAFNIYPRYKKICK
mmetsp:Transcript_10806/g.14075  ORF Transcript_10806/g.14075 Transcript_10806/m.14075 type:complete len:420 (-) Transcript_10806:672-1931(-)